MPSSLRGGPAARDSDREATLSQPVRHWCNVGADRRPSVTRWAGFERRFRWGDYHFRSRSAASNALGLSAKLPGHFRGRGLRGRAAQRARMLYQAYQAHSDIMVPVRTLAGVAVQAIGPPGGMNGATPGFLRNLTAAYELVSRAGLSHTRPSFAIGSVMVANQEVGVREEAAHTTAFDTLLHVRKDVAMAQPPVL